MIITCTYNPAIDYRMEVDSFQEGDLNRTTYNKFTAGGKGINVSKVLSNLGVETVTTGFIGGFTGQFIRDYATTEYQLQTHFITINELTRVNVKLNNNGTETEINALGPIVQQVEMNQLLEFIDTFQKGDLVAIGGSPSGGIANTYIPLVKKCVDKDIEFVLDTNKQSLLECLSYQPLLIKPNIHELRELFEEPIETIADIIKYSRTLIEMGAKNVIVSRGGDDPIFVNKEVAYIATQIQGEVKNTVGAGDSMVAGFIKGYSDGLIQKDTFRLAVACGTATAFSYDLASEKDVQDITKKIIIKEVSA